MCIYFFCFFECDDFCFLVSVVVKLTMRITDYQCFMNDCHAVTLKVKSKDIHRHEQNERKSVDLFNLFAIQKFL